MKQYQDNDAVEQYFPKIRTTIDARTLNVTLPDGSALDIISPRYVYTLEDKILETQKQNAILNDKLIGLNTEIKRLKAAIRKMESMLR